MAIENRYDFVMIFDVENGNPNGDPAVNACTVNPAECLGIDNRKGKLCAGYDADIVVLNEDYSVEAAFCRGRKQSRK